MVQTDMMVILVQLFVLLPIVIPITVSSDVFKVVGDTWDIHVDKQKTANLKELKWLFNSKFILKYSKLQDQVDVYAAYKGRVEFKKIQFSLTLKNLVKNDTGRYKVKTDDDEGENTIAENTLIVLDPVAAPNLTFSPPQQSQDTCKVSCESQDLSVSTSCSNETCEANNATSSNLNLVLHVTGTTVNCTVSNKAMWISTTLDIKLCEGNSNKSTSNGSSLQGCAVVVFTVLLVSVIVS